MSSRELSDLILHGREERNLEYKTSMNWTSAQTKAKVAKSAMAMANIPDGGAIVFGVDQSGEMFLPNGMTPEDFRSFSQDDVMEYVNGFADPYTELTVSPDSFEDGRQFLVIQIRAFDQLPVVCKKEGEQRLRRGALYTRSRRKHETVQVSSQTEMREILDRAVDWEIRRLRERGILVAAVGTAEGDEDQAAFEDQLGGL